MNPLVSIIIPCHNAAPWLAEAIGSALAQSCPRKEIIVINDGSRDDSLAVAQRFAREGVQVVDQPNRGASAARNAGLRLARGDWVQFLDADDLLGADKIASQLARLADAPPETVASCRWARFSDAAETAVFGESAAYRDFQPARDFLLHHAATGEMMQPAAWLAPRSLLESVGPWDESLSLNDDGEYFCRVLARTSGVRFADTGRVFYRSAPNSLSQRRSRKAMASLHRSLELNATHLLAEEDSPRVRAALCESWERARFEFYPDAPDLSRDAARRARELGQPQTAYPATPRLRWVERWFGWKLARRLQRMAARSRLLTVQKA